jgi:hypothetical protein
MSDAGHAAGGDPGGHDDAVEQASAMSEVTPNDVAETGRPQAPGSNRDQPDERAGRGRCVEP